MMKKNVSSLFDSQAVHLILTSFPSELKWYYKLRWRVGRSTPDVAGVPFIDAFQPDLPTLHEFVQENGVAAVA